MNKIVSVRILGLWLLLLSVRTEQSVQIVDLTSENLDDFINSNPCVLLIFHVPECQFCQKLEIELIGLVERIKKQDLSAKVARLNMVNELELKERFQIFEYPTVKLAFEGLVLDYLGAREQMSLMSYLVHKLDIDSNELTEMEEFDEIKLAEVSVVLILTEENQRQQQIFEIYSSEFEDIFFFHANFKEAVQSIKATKKNNFVVYKNLRKKPQILSSNELISWQEMKRFFDRVRFPIVMRLDGPGSERIFNDKKTSVFLFTHDKPHLEDTFLEIAKKYAKYDLVFCQTSMTDSMGFRLGEYFQMNELDENTIRILEFKDGKSFKHKLSKLDDSEIIKFLDFFLAGKSTPYFKTQKEFINAGSAVKKIVGANFDTWVLKSKENVLLFILSPVCTHCKKLATMIPVLTEKLSEFSDRLFVCQMDGTENEHAALDVLGYPMIMFYPANNKSSPEFFKGERTVVAITDFIREKMRIQTLDDSL